MTDNKLSFLKNTFSSYKVQFSDDFTCATIYNPFYDENITIYYYEDDDFSPFCARFSFQHRHLTDEDDVVEWINEIITGNKFAIEFFQKNQCRFGSEIAAEELEDLTYTKLEQFSGYYGLTKLFEIADSFKVRGWNNINNFDAVFVCETDKKITIKILKI